jgi:hypothetical protein
MSSTITIRDGRAVPGSFGYRQPWIMKAPPIWISGRPWRTDEFECAGFSLWPIPAGARVDGKGIRSGAAQGSGFTFQAATGVSQLLCRGIEHPSSKQDAGF